MNSAETSKQQIVEDFHEPHMIPPHHRSIRAQRARGMGTKTPVYQQPWAIFSAIVIAVCVVLAIVS